MCKLRKWRSTLRASLGLIPCWGTLIWPGECLGPCRPQKKAFPEWDQRQVLPTAGQLPAEQGRPARSQGLPRAECPLVSVPDANSLLQPAAHAPQAKWQPIPVAEEHNSLPGGTLPLMPQPPDNWLHHCLKRCPVLPCEGAPHESSLVRQLRARRRLRHRNSDSKLPFILKLQDVRAALLSFVAWQGVAGLMDCNAAPMRKAAPGEHKRCHAGPRKTGSAGRLAATGGFQRKSNLD